jgi:hypothetical protein
MGMGVREDMEFITNPRPPTHLPPFPHPHRYILKYINVTVTSNETTPYCIFFFILYLIL